MCSCAAGYQVDTFSQMCTECDVGFGFVWDYTTGKKVCSPCSAKMLEGKGQCNGGAGGYADAKTGKFSKQPEAEVATADVLSKAALSGQCGPAARSCSRCWLVLAALLGLPRIMVFKIRASSPALATARSLACSAIRSAVADDLLPPRFFGRAACFPGNTGAKCDKCTDGFIPLEVSPLCLQCREGYTGGTCALLMSQPLPPRSAAASVLAVPRCEPSSLVLSRQQP